MNTIDFNTFVCPVCFEGGQQQLITHDNKLHHLCMKCRPIVERLFGSCPICRDPLIRENRRIEIYMPGEEQTFRVVDHPQEYFEAKKRPREEAEVPPLMAPKRLRF